MDIDTPLILSFLFHPRPAKSGGNKRPGVSDGTIPVGDGVVLGYRIFKREEGGPVVVYFHGNGEIASDYDDIAPLFHQAGASLIVIDYRGYGWSTGEPKVSTLLLDAEKAFKAVPDVLTWAGIHDAKLFLMGRSLGSGPAIHLAAKYTDKVQGLIIESGFAQILPLVARLGLPLNIPPGTKDPIGNQAKIGKLLLPLLVIHGDRDQIIPVAEGQALYDASPTPHKVIRRMPNAGHNDLLYYALEAYFAAVAEFLRQHTE